MVTTKVLARRFHGNVGHLAVLQPGAHLLQIPGKCRKLPSLHFQVRLADGRQHAHRDTVLVDVDATTTSMLCFHNRLLTITGRRTPGMVKRHSCSCSSAVAETTVPDSSNRVLTRFTHGLWKAPTENRPLLRGGSASSMSNLSSLPHFHPSCRRHPNGAVQWFTRRIPPKSSSPEASAVAPALSDVSAGLPPPHFGQP